MDNDSNGQLTADQFLELVGSRAAELLDGYLCLDGRRIDFDPPERHAAGVRRAGGSDVETTTTRLMTADEFFALYENDRVELVRGEWRRCPCPAVDSD